MKYTASNKPLVCMQTQSTCYKSTKKMEVKGVLWHSTAANNPTIKRYVQPSDVKPEEDTYTKEKWLEVLGKNKYANDWNHIEHQAGLNGWIGKLADGTITTVQTMPWDFRPWGCGKGAYGSCNDGWVQFEICEDDLTSEEYFNAVYTEACEFTAYICKIYNIDPLGTAVLNDIKVPTIICHADSHKLGLGSNHGDIYHWFKKYNKTMDDVRNDVAELLAEAVKVKTYELVTAVPVYASADDAKAKKNAKGTYKQGTYYIYNKYPDGKDGMLNISTDDTGKTAGGWINPEENAIKESVESTPDKLYRVRKAKNDSASQKGAFSDLDNAKECCQKAGDGYHVFDWDYKIVYSYTAPEPPKESEKPIEVYDLDYPEKNKIVDKGIRRLDADCVKAIKKILSNNNDFDIEIAKAFFKLAPKYGIDPMMAISQSILETGWFKYKGSAVTADQHNYCGLAVVSTGVKGAAFDTIEDGVTAQLQHLFAYGCKEALPENEAILDPRFSLVIRGVAQYWQQLAGRWACPGYDTTKYATPAEAMVAGNTYGQKIYTIYEQLCAVEVSEEEIQQYFPTVKDEPVVDEPVIDETTPEANSTDDKVAAFTMLFEAIKKLIIAIINIFTKKN